MQPWLALRVRETRLGFEGEGGTRCPFGFEGERGPRWRFGLGNFVRRVGRNPSAGADVFCLFWLRAELLGALRPTRSTGHDVRRPTPTVARTSACRRIVSFRSSTDCRRPGRARRGTLGQ